MILYKPGKMKTINQIKQKIAEHEKLISNLLLVDKKDIENLKHLRNGRMALIWVLSNEDKIDIDELTRQIDFEILCEESTEIF
jgi:hypothetical protein